MEITGTFPLSNSTLVFHTRNSFIFPSTHVKPCISHGNHRVSSRQEAAEYVFASPSPLFFLYPPASSLILWGCRAVGFVQKNGVGNPLEGPSQFSRIDGSSPLSEGANARKIICHLGGLLISMECNSSAALAQGNLPPASLSSSAASARRKIRLE